MSNFYIVDLEYFATASRRYTGVIHNSVRSRTMEATRSHHCWVHMFITHQPTVTLQLHNFDLFRTCRTSSFCTVAWQLARFQLTRRNARSLGDSWASYIKQHSETDRVCSYQNTDCSLENKFIVLFIIIFRTLSFRILIGTNFHSNFSMECSVLSGINRI